MHCCLSASRFPRSGASIAGASRPELARAFGGAAVTRGTPTAAPSHQPHADFPQLPSLFLHHPAKLPAHQYEPGSAKENHPPQSHSPPVRNTTSPRIVESSDKMSLQGYINSMSPTPPRRTTRSCTPLHVYHPLHTATLFSVASLRPRKLTRSSRAPPQRKSASSRWTAGRWSGRCCRATR